MTRPSFAFAIVSAVVFIVEWVAGINPPASECHHHMFLANVRSFPPQPGTGLTVYPDQRSLMAEESLGIFLVRLIRCLLVRDGRPSAGGQAWDFLSARQVLGPLSLDVPLRIKSFCQPWPMQPLRVPFAHASKSFSCPSA
ncbi:hypothetical protein F5X99DRAFT_228482 [Biscogniauxia marginata]|nr:hypothetical protein F5X99DRAFT_228482 [Biscogniauxia marginata]